VWESSNHHPENLFISSKTNNSKIQVEVPQAKNLVAQQQFAPIKTALLVDSKMSVSDLRSQD